MLVVSESTGSLAPSQQAPADHHSMNVRSVDSWEPHWQQRAPLSEAGTYSCPASAPTGPQRLAIDLERLPYVEQPPAVHRSVATQQWVADSSNRRKDGGKVKKKVSKTNAKQTVKQTDNLEVNSQLETLISQHARAQPHVSTQSQIHPQVPMPTGMQPPPCTGPWTACRAGQTKKHCTHPE